MPDNNPYIRSELGAADPRSADIAPHYFLVLKNIQH